VFLEPRRDHVLSDATPAEGNTSLHQPTLLLCGYFGFEAATLSPLLEILPSLSIIRAEELRRHRWLRSTLEQLSREYRSQQPGSALAVDRLTEIVFFELIRINFGRHEQAKFVAALRDRRISKALQKLHEKPQGPWTLEKLASEIGLSRPAFAQRFKELVGQSMFEYLTMLRMERAKELLRHSGLPLFDIAERVGYTSDLTLTKTFRKLVGETPTRFRKRHHSGRGEGDDMTA